MPYFVHDKSKDKLTILYFTKAINLDIAREQIYRAMVDNDCMTFLDFEIAAGELEEDGQIAAIPRPFGQAYRVTARGEEMLRLFEESLPFSLRSRLDAYSDENRDQMRVETQLVSSMEPLKSGAYLVHLKAQETEMVVLDIAFRVPTREMALRVRSNWIRESEGIYQHLLSHLLKPDDAASPEDMPDNADEQKEN